MALSESEKLLNKAASKLRSQLFYARRREFDKKTEAAVKAAEESPAHKEFVDASVALDAALQAKRETRATIEAQIAELKRQLSQLDTDAKLDDLQQHRRQTGNAYTQYRNSLIKAAEVGYEDVAKTFTCGGWMSLAEVIDKYRDQLDCSTKL